MESFVIEGGVPLRGSVRPAGNKNAALPILAACLLTADPVTLDNVPRIRDVEAMIELLCDIGADVEWLGPNRLRVWAADIAKTALDAELCTRIRASILFAGPLLARCGTADVPPPGGDVIGRRRVDTHLMAFAALGADVQADRSYRLRAPSGLRGADLYLDEASVTGTENAVMAAVLARGKTTIENAACEPHVQDLCHLLEAMGARIDGIGSNVLTIHGVRVARRLRPPDRPRPHRGGVVHRPRRRHRRRRRDRGRRGRAPALDPAHVLAARRHGRGRRAARCACPPGQTLRIVDDVHAQIPKVEDGPWPMFPADLTSIAVAVATQATGTVLIFEKMFENRLIFTDKLVSMGARIILCDPHRVVVTGPAQLYGERMASPDIRAGMAMLIASLCAEGESRIGNVSEIDRGYERIDERLRALGARIERVPG